MSMIWKGYRANAVPPAAALVPTGSSRITIRPSLLPWQALSTGADAGAAMRRFGTALFDIVNIGPGGAVPRRRGQGSERAAAGKTAQIRSVLQARTALADRASTRESRTMTATASPRLPAIDALRGFALFGILVVNLAAFHSGFAGMALGGGLGAAAWRDSATDAVIAWMFAGKFILMFSFVFGWGVYTQAARGEGFRARYVRRLLGLVLLGAVHATFLFMGDILVAYALLGVFMLRPIGRDWPVRRLVRSAAILFAVQAAILLGLTALAFGGGGHEDPWLTEYARRSTAAYRTGDFWSVVPQRLTDFSFGLVGTLATLGWGLLAMFRLGLAAAKTFAQGGAEAARPLARRILLPALTLGLAGNAACAALQVGFREPWASSAMMVQYALFTPTLALGYLAAAVLVLTSPAGSRLIALLGPAGRMSLSVYVGQSVLMSLLLHGYGIGLSNSIGSAVGVLVCIGVYAALLGFSHLWLGVFRIGPLEWVLRSITEWRWVALRPARQSEAAPA
jgi:uncharacterized protein